MRDYSKIAPSFWTGETGRKIRAAGPDAQRVALYLLTCPNSNWIGLYYLPLPTLCHEVGISEKGACKALRSLSEAHFAYYEAPSEVVFVPEMARYQVGDSLDPKDNRIKGIIKELTNFSKSKFAKMFYDRYAGPFNLPVISIRNTSTSPSEAPSKPLRSQEQEQEQEQEKEQNTSCAEVGKADSTLEASPIPEPFISIPLNTGEEYPVTPEQVAEFKALYPAVDVEQELRAMRGWSISNPKRRKTRDGVPRFINSWLAGKQNKPNSNGSKAPMLPLRPGTDIHERNLGTFQRFVERSNEAK